MVIAVARIEIGSGVDRIGYKFGDNRIGQSCSSVEKFVHEFVRSVGIVVCKRTKILGSKRRIFDKQPCEFRIPENSHIVTEIKDKPMV